MGDNHGAGRCYESEVWNDDFIPRRDAKSRHGDFQRGRTIRHCDAMTRSMKLRESLFEFEGLRTRRAPPDTAFQHFFQRLHFFIVVIRPEGKGLVLRLLAAE